MHFGELLVMQKIGNTIITWDDLVLPTLKIKAGRTSQRHVYKIKFTIIYNERTKE